MTRTELFAALSAATGPSRELDAEIDALRTGWIPSHRCHDRTRRSYSAGMLFKYDDWRDILTDETACAPDWTGSTDTALTLLGAEYGHWYLSHPGYEDGRLLASYRFELHSKFSSGGGPKWVAFKETAPLAVCLAWARSLP